MIQEPSNVKAGHGGEDAGAVEGREQVFWDDHVSSLECCRAEYEAGPDALTAAALQALEPAGAKVLDFACGTGVTSAWLAARGAEVVGADVSRRSIDRARELCESLGLQARFVAGSVDALAEEGPFDRIFGRFALHHVDCTEVGPALSRLLRPGGIGAFVETMDSNPALRFARRRLVGRFGIPRYGTVDEHPLTDTDLDALRRAFGTLRVDVPQMTFFRIADRQLLQYRAAFASRLAGAIDDALLGLGFGSWSYHQVLVVTRDGG